MTKTPNLGTTWEEAVKSSYAHGYHAFENCYAEVAEEAKEIAEESDDIGLAVHFLMNDTAGQAMVSESMANKRLWWAIEDFYEAHMGEEAYERLMREAAVAEDLDSAFQAGAYDALLEQEYDLSKVAHFHGGEDDE